MKNFKLHEQVARFLHKNINTKNVATSESHREQIPLINSDSIGYLGFKNIIRKL